LAFLPPRRKKEQTLRLSENNLALLVRPGVRSVQVKNHDPVRKEMLMRQILKRSFLVSLVAVFGQAVNAATIDTVLASLVICPTPR
jgi:hypothetical protein